MPDAEMPVASTSGDIIRSDQHHDVLVLCLTCLIRWLAARRRNGAKDSNGGLQTDRASTLDPGEGLPSSPLSQPDPHDEPDPGHRDHRDQRSRGLIPLDEFKKAWKDLKFTHIYSSKAKSTSAESFMQQLYDACFQMAVVRMTVSDVQNVVKELTSAGVSLKGEETDEYVDTGCIPVPNTSTITLDEGEIREVTRWFNENQPVKDRLALFALWCCFAAQPAPLRIAVGQDLHQMVLVRVEERYREILGRWTGIIERECLCQRRGNDTDFVLVYAAMWKRGVFVFGSNVGGFTPGCLSGLGAYEDDETEEERALTRDLRFHVTSTLKGMGVEDIERLCGAYAASLKDVMVLREEPGVVGQEGGVGIADLKFGEELRRAVENGRERMRYQLYGAGGEGKMIAGFQKQMKRERAAERGGGAIISRVMQREKARKMDIRKKKKAMLEAMGLQEEKEEEKEEEEEMEGEDMPDLDFDGLAALVGDDVGDDDNDKDNDKDGNVEDNSG